VYVDRVRGGSCVAGFVDVVVGCSLVVVLWELSFGREVCVLSFKSVV